MGNGSSLIVGSGTTQSALPIQVANDINTANSLSEQPSVNWSQSGTVSSGGAKTGAVKKEVTVVSFASISGALPTTAPTADFEYTVMSDGLVAFRSKSLGVIDSYHWDFGDDQTANGDANQLHLYTGTGTRTYSVTLSVANTGGASQKTSSITVTQIVDTVDFTYTLGALSVQLTNTSTRSGEILWDFGDDTTSTELSPYHEYETFGTYQVTLTIAGKQKTYPIAVDRGVLLTWTDNSSIEDGFKIERSPNGSSGWAEIATTTADQNTLLVTLNLHGVDPSATNYFRVRAYNGGGDSGYSNTASSNCL